MGVKSIFIDDLREEFVKDYVFPMFRANAQYEVSALARGCMLLYRGVGWPRVLAGPRVLTRVPPGVGSGWVKGAARTPRAAGEAGLSGLQARTLTRLTRAW
jgi:hypothetical protein